MTFELRKENGQYITQDQLYDLAKDAIIEELDDMDEDDALELGNVCRERHRYNILYKNDEDNLNDQLGGEDAWTLLNLDWSDYEEYFTWDGYDLCTTDDIWDDVGEENLAKAILDGEYSEHLTGNLEDILSAYEEAKEVLENLNPHREGARKVLNDYLNCKADVADLLQCIDKLVRNDAVWNGEEE